MPNETQQSEENRLLREEVEQQKREAIEREEREEKSETLKNRVSVAAIVLTTALSFIGQVKSDRADAASSSKQAAAAARLQAAELWGWYQTKQSERTSLELGKDRIRLDLKTRGLPRGSPETKLEVMKMTGYEERIDDFDLEARRVFFHVQELEATEDVKQREAIEPSRAVVRYELGAKLITLALILLSVTILSNREALLWCGVLLGSTGVLVAFDGYFLFL
jgi:hypothetical protein